jgi:hypothetical protein
MFDIWVLIDIYIDSDIVIFSKAPKWSLVEKESLRFLGIEKE